MSSLLNRALNPMTTRLMSLLGAVLVGGTLTVSAFTPAYAEEGPEPLPFHAEPTNLLSAQRGARNFMNYCSGCHSMKYQRYSRIGQDLGITEDVMKKNLMFTSEKPGDTIVSAMPISAKEWFGQQPPDLTLETKARGPEWVYSYLMSFYLDDKRPMGVNNLYLPGVGMPHVLGSLQGWQVKEKVEGEHPEGAAEEEEFKLKLVQEGSMTPDQYRDFVTDLVNYMTYAGEPNIQQRISTGIRVMIYLVILLVLTYLLKKEFWRDIH